MAGRARKIVLRVIAGISIAGVAIILFLFYSLLVTFDNWPWTRTQSFTIGSYLGFTIQSDSRQSFDQAIELQRTGIIRALTLLDQRPTTYKNRYKGNPIQETDFEYVSKIGRWHLGLTDCNCWLILEFSDNKLKKLVRYEYHGPTE